MTSQKRSIPDGANGLSKLLPVAPKRCFQAVLIAGLVIFAAPTTSIAAGRDCRDLFSATKTTAIRVSNPERAVTEVLSKMGIVVGGTRPQDLRVNDPAFFRSVLTDPHLKLGETYMNGMWDSDSIDQLLYQVMSVKNANPVETLKPLRRTPLLVFQGLLNSGFRNVRDTLINRQTRRRSKTVAEEHYDAGNDLYRQMLDPTLTYTSGVWRDGFTLEDAQNAKYDLICRKLGLKPGDKVLDIGSGFGGFARFAAKNYGAEVTGITISIEQLKAARALSQDVRGVDFIFSDYRDLPYRFPENAFDHLVSIEMIEAVGVKNLHDYFNAAQAVLKPGGRFLIQAIASNVDVVNSNAWFSKYIFRDGVAPSTNQVDRAARAFFGSPADRHRITSDYDRTLMEWHANFQKAWPNLRARYGDRFKRMWDFYLLSVAGGFRAKRVQLDQTVFVKGGDGKDVPHLREPLDLNSLKNMRQTVAERERTRLLIEDLEQQKDEQAKALSPRLHSGSLDKSARIAIVGAGPGGLSAAAELQRLGYKNVRIFEKNSEAGGKSHTVQYEGRSHDMGATMGIPYKYAAVQKLAAEQNVTTIPFPVQVDYDLATGGKAPSPTLKRRLNIAFQAIVYMINHAKMSGADQRGLEVPPPELADPWQVVMDRAGTGALGDRMKTYLTGYGYGGPETPAIFAHRMLDVNAIIGSAISKPIMWDGGTQPIWKSLASQLGVETNADVTHIERSSKGVRLVFSDNRAPETFDKLILAVDPTIAIQIVDPTAEETSVFSQVRHIPYATFAVRVKGHAEGRSEVGYLRENMTLEREGHPMAWIKRYPDDNLFIFHLFAPSSLSDAQIMSRISGDMKKLGATELTLVDSRRWPFFPHVDAHAMRAERFFERAAALQGRNNTVFVNEALGMSTMPDAARVGTNAAQRLTSGEYGN